MLGQRQYSNFLWQNAELVSTGSSSANSRLFTVNLVYCKSSHVTELVYNWIGGHGTVDLMKENCW
jgi:hypothetical protein